MINFIILKQKENTGRKLLKKVSPLKFVDKKHKSFILINEKGEILILNYTFFRYFIIRPEMDLSVGRKYISKLIIRSIVSDLYRVKPFSVL